MTDIEVPPPTQAGPARIRVYEWLRDEIIRGSIEAGRFLDEQWVSEAVGVSRTPVREAFHQLAAERFISLLPRKGAQVRTVTSRELEEVYRTRLLIEGHALSVMCALERRVPVEMFGLIEQMEEAGDALDWFTVSYLDRRFHRAMVAAADNTVLTELYDTLRSRQQRVAVRALTARPERVEIINKQHRAIVDALSKHDAAAALQLLELHLRPISEITSVLPTDD
ncbi:GntR family transcriptional regulator [Pseudarthrobacter sulfonivorans]|uniref:GntR family transcriptional regulator n=1 Tax=Pseudarthrobacter sulfonivorans TaxID=121292 RepID=A0A0U3QZR8_9MICC|nr:GntR family transcriptional regulator [Pseudarthrobacter sulfonivorans]ALV42348.1 GntR family transcriptional regulator [Pseudarthrobacter sulfonivorans]